ncbi:MAG: RES family NAD+ phosphorylase [Candidatus Eremiobacteraeota bacterium]|nr:RES family NAD+ phosphorylase [Candidatus Eremiobacteraeota bacterium]
MRAEERPEATFGVCYLGWGREAAFAESFLRRPGVQLIPLATFDARALTEIESTRPLRLVAFVGPGLAAVGATAAVSHGPHEVARRWARALWAHPDQPDGLAYRCRHGDDALAVALFDRAADALAIRETSPMRADRVWFGQMLNRYGLVLAD